MKDIYEAPELEMIFLESEDTICASGPNETPTIPPHKPTETSAE